MQRDHITSRRRSVHAKLLLRFNKRLSRMVTQIVHPLMRILSLLCLFLFIELESIIIPTTFKIFLFSFLKKKKLKSALIADRHVLVGHANSTSNEESSVLFACGNDDACVFGGAQTISNLFCWHKDALRSLVHSRSCEQSRPKSIIGSFHSL